MTCHRDNNISDSIIEFRNEYKNITNITLKEHLGVSLLPAYCAGINLPFFNNTSSVISINW